MRINLIFNSFWGVVYKFWQLICETFFLQIRVLLWKYVYTCKFSCIVIVDMCVRSYVPILQIN